MSVSVKSYWNLDLSENQCLAGKQSLNTWSDCYCALMASKCSLIALGSSKACAAFAVGCSLATLPTVSMAMSTVLIPFTTPLF